MTNYGPPGTGFLIGTRKRQAPGGAPAGRAPKRAKGRLRRRRGLNVRSGGFVGIENKFYDQSVNGSSVSVGNNWSGCEEDPGTTQCLSAPSQGDGESQRDGRKCKATSIYVGGAIRWPNHSGHAEACYVTIALVQDTQTNGAQLNAEDVYINPAATPQTNGTPLRNMQYMTRFKVLKKITLFTGDLSAHYNGSSANSEGYTVPFSIFKKLNMPITFTGTTEGVANVTDNSLHLIVAGGPSTATGAPAPEIYYNSRMRFIG